MQSTQASPKAQEAESATDVSDTKDVNTVQNKDSNLSASTKSDSALELTHEALFATRYVTAEKFGQANNDPRVVRSQLKQAEASQTKTSQKLQANEQSVVKAPSIRGTVGEFIRATLPEAQTRLAEEGVINCFIETIALHSKQVQEADSDANVDTINSSGSNTELAGQSFDFSNYGYQPLTKDYLARFDTMTQAVSQFAAPQGKTDVEPRAISKRASNDPRGQHPDYQEAVHKEPTHEQAASLNADAKKDAETQMPNESNNDSKQTASQQIGHDVDAHDIEATALTNQAQTDSVSTDSEQLLEADAKQAQAAIQQSEAENSETQSVATEATDTALDEQSADAVKETESKDEQSTKEDSQAAKSKTTIASYKNMIENVAEQLLPQTGMFNLTTPKVPKARTRKPKIDHKKPTQAEKLEADDGDGES